MKTIRYLVDENTTRAILAQLRHKQPQIEIVLVGDEGAPPRGTTDPEILAWLEREGYCLITRNRKTIPQHLGHHLQTGRHVPGILLLKPDATIGQILETLVLIWEASETEEYQDRIVHIPL